MSVVAAVARRTESGVSRADGPVRHGEAGIERVAASRDAECVQAALEGDEAAGARLVHVYVRKAMAVAMEYMRAREDAEDVVQDTFRSAFANLHRFDQRRSFGPWFFTILRNAARNALASRRIRSHEPVAPEHSAVQATPLDELHRQELRHAIESAIERLPLMQQTCFRLCVVEELTAGEAASATGPAESTVRVHVYRARRALQALLDRWREEGQG